jgi:uncharacterized ferritin-like protein (DUF455 family)
MVEGRSDTRLAPSDCPSTTPLHGAVPLPEQARGGTLGAACLAVLSTADPARKIKAARAAARDWRLGKLAWTFDAEMPARPARPEQPLLLPPNQMPRRGKGGSDANRIAFFHALAHIEFVAIDLAFDLLGRFGSQFPRAFTDDWMKVGADEAMHFAIIDRRLRQFGSYYGALPAHDGLWEAAEATAHDALARLAVVPMVLEARGLDVTPQMIQRFEAAGDAASVRLLGRILADEVVHVAAGVRWFRFGCDSDNDSPVETWQKLVATHFGGVVKPPFNDSARSRAGLTPDFYMGIAEPYAHAAQKFRRRGRGNSRRRSA